VSSTSALRPDAEGSGGRCRPTYTNALHRFDAPQSSVSVLHGQTLLDGALRTPPQRHLHPHRARHRGRARPRPRPPRPAPPDLRPGLPHHAQHRQRLTQLPLFAPGSSTVTSVAPGADGTGGIARLRRPRRPSQPRSLRLRRRARQFLVVTGFPLPDAARAGESYTGSATYDVTPWLQLGLDGIYTRTVAHRGYNVFRGDLNLDAANTLNPFGQTVRVSSSRLPRRSAPTTAKPASTSPPPSSAPS